MKGPLAAGIPGTPAAIVHIANNYGRLPLRTSLNAAINLARNGFPVSEFYNSRASAVVEHLKSFPQTAELFLQGGEVPQIGYVLKQSDLGNVLEKISEYKAQNKIEVKNTFAEDIPYNDSSFDLLFCSGVFMFTKQDKALSEFNRVIKDGGKLLITANGIGYFIMYLLNGMRYFSTKKTRYGLKGLVTTLVKWITGKQYGVSAVNHNEMREKLKEHGFELYDTRLWIDMDLYPLEHLGFPTNYAFVARKKHPAA